MTIECKVELIESLASNTYRIILKPTEAVSFKAGQYLLAVLGEKDKRAFSIANSPCREGILELHIGAADHNPYALEVVDKAKQCLENEELFVIDGPHGSAWLKEESDKPLLLIAGGTGFSYVRSILDQCVSRGLTQPIAVYWGGRDSYQLYASKELQSIADQYDNIQFTPVVENPDSEWSGKVGNVLEAVMEDFDSLADHEIYIAGRFEMAGAARTLFTEQRNVTRDQIFSDAFSFI
ncbi:NAD(P)H-flavin reductase [Vibrio sp. SS-MA-C1-2]|uniref:NAD(P)H-flavin reductase n=1 Tax=Vibrio sp. SS-MA-C1-2 TaxID=2908646 RepID=UPI001F46A2D6|nr:NAD(P)H-flavin reductase [Vibrio sp. SS-MA-C1-2]UJF19402.1 NAD(P)H-flavin reductase [Vibrio sp. SS-MA-C1-2]